jgi:hypothetical protein
MGRGTGRYGYLVEAFVAAAVCAAAANCCVRPMFGRKRGVNTEWWSESA